MGKPNMHPSKEAVRTSDGLPAVKHPVTSNPQSGNLSPDGTCKGIKVTLDNNSMWNEFFRCRTEMILTKQGSRMFPYCRFRISGLHPSRKYSLIMEIQPLDNNRYKWTGKSWQVAGKAECRIKSQPFAHPECPSVGQHWMQNPVSFYKLKLTNNISDQEGNTVLHPMHRYLPRLHVVQTDKAAKDIKLNGPGVVTFTFPQTEFMAVTAYQNSRFSQLKVDYNPFAKGLKEDGSSSWALKLKLNSGKDAHKDGDATTAEQHPVKKSLKSLLANHKPRSSKVADSKPLVSHDLQKDPTPNKDESTSKVTGECSCSNSHPAQKLFSELIREAHVSLQRCNLEQLGINSSASHRTERPNAKTTASKSNGLDVSRRDGISVKTHRQASPARKGEAVVAERTVGEEGDSLKDDVRTDCSEVGEVAAAPAESQISSVDLQREPGAPSEVKVKQHKRPAPLPLPALARFLKQHSTKSKKAKSKPDSPPPALPSDSPTESLSSGAAPASRSPDHATIPSKDLTGHIAESDSTACGHTAARLYQGETVFNVTGPAVETTRQPSSPSRPDGVASQDPKGPRTDDFSASVPAAESTGPEPDGTPVLPNLDQPISNFGKSISTISSTRTTSSASTILSPPHDKALAAPNSPQTPPTTESSTLPSYSPAMASDSLLPDPECSSFGFEPMSPASSPEALPSLPVSLTIELDSTTSEPTPKVTAPEELPHGKDSAVSVFKWHTVLPPPEPYVHSSFTTFTSTPQTLPLASVQSPLLPSQSPTLSEPHTFHTSTSMPPPDPDPDPDPDPAPSLPESEQLLPFPAELSPLALQLPLSPTFSSLDADGLSPTPSLADLVHFFSTDDDLGMGVDFSNTEVVGVPCPPTTTVEANTQQPCQQVQPIPAQVPRKRRKKSRRRKLAKMTVDQKVDDSTYTCMQPSLEEVEEQLFISFTSKEALKLHIVDPSEGSGSQPPMTPEGHLQQAAAAAPENGNTTMETAEKIAEFEKILLRDLKLMRHRQVIHPVLQEVGLKMNLLDATLSIDLQYLGVRLPIPPPGVSVEPPTQELPPSQGVCVAFVSRTGKTTDVTRIKGWREKFTPSEAPSTPAPAKPEGAGSSSDPQKKNLSAFCSDMLDEYLENEGKLIDERAASFSQPVVEPVVYELPTRSTSYVRTLDSILKKQTGTSDLISGFIPPSKRPKFTPRETRASRREPMKKKGPKRTKNRPESAAAPLSAPGPSPAESNAVPKRPAVQIPAAAPPSEQTVHATEPHKSKKHHLKVRFDLSEPPPAFRRRRKLKPKSSSQTLGVSEDMAPLESDSELGADQGVGQSEEASRKVGGPTMTRALLRQKDLEDGVVWEGRPRTAITEERAAIALTSLFTLMGFVSENPTAPLQLVRRRPPPCLNEFCRLGCVCSSLSHSATTSHCGRPPCMLGCSCLKQKVVLLKNLDSSDSSPSHLGNRRKRRKRRMKMAYILKEADSVSQPAERVRTLWKRGGGDLDPDPIHVPDPASLTRFTGADSSSSCARVRGFREKTAPQKHKQKQSKDVRLKQRGSTLKDSQTSGPPPAREPVQSGPSSRPASPPEDPKPSKRLIIVAECGWESDGDRSHVLKKLCEALALDQLDQPFWIRKYFISPMCQTEEETSADCCVQYKIHISRPKEGPGGPAAPRRPTGRRRPHRQGTGEQVEEEEEEEEPLEDWQREVEEEEEEPLEDWQREVEEDDFEEEEGSTVHQVHDGKESGREDMRTISKKKRRRMANMALPFLTGISPAGFLSANKKQAGGTDHLVQVNGKLYPLARIQLGKMGALHPANRLAAYLTGRVGSTRKQPGSSSSSSSSKPPQSSGPTPHIPPSAVPGHGSAPPPSVQAVVTVLTPPHASPAPPPAAIKLHQPAAASDRPAGEAPEGAGSQVVTVRVYQPPTAGASQVRVVPAASGGFSAAGTDPQVSCSVLPAVSPAPRGSQMLMLQVPSPSGKISGPVPTPPPPFSTSQRMVLQRVQTASGGQYYRRPDGKLVQLVPLSQLRPVGQTPSVRRGPSSPTVVPAPSQQTPVITVCNQTPPPKAARAPTSSHVVSSLQYLTMLPPPVPRHPTPPSLAQKGMCTFKIILSDSSKEPQVIVSSARGSPTPPHLLLPPPGSSSPTVAPAPSRPAVTVGNQAPPPTAASTPTSSLSKPSGLHTLSVSRPPTALVPTPPPEAQKAVCFKVLPPKCSKEPIAVGKVPPKPPDTLVMPTSTFTLLQPHVPPPRVNLISLKPSAGQGAELGVKTVAVSAVPAGPGGAVVHRRPASPPTGNPSVQPPAGTAHRPPTPPRPAGSEITPAPAPSPPAEAEPARDPVDLDIICVDDETGLVAMETGHSATRTSDPPGESMDAAELRELLDTMELEVVPSSETEDSSDFEDESESDEETTDGETTDGEPIDGETTDGEPIDGEPIDGEPIDGEPIDGETTDGEPIDKVPLKRYIHNVLERQRREKIQQLMDALRTEIGLSNRKTSKISTLQTAVQLIEDLRAADVDLMRMKSVLMKMRDDHLSAIALITEENRQVSRQENRQVSRRRQRPPRSEPSAERGTGSEDAALMEVVDLLDELTDNSSDEERAVAMTTNTVTKTTDAVAKAEDGVPSVAMETVEDGGRLNEAQRRPARVAGNKDAGSSTTVGGAVMAAIGALSPTTNTENSPKTLPLEQQEIQTPQSEQISLNQQRNASVRHGSEKPAREAASEEQDKYASSLHQEIQSLQSEENRLRSLKICLNQQRNAYIRQVAQRSGKSEQMIRGELQRLLSKQEGAERQKGLRAANQLPAALTGGGASNPAAGDTTRVDAAVTSSDPNRTAQAPPSTAPVQTPVQQAQRALQVMRPAPALSHNASVVQSRQRTVPNILSRSKNRAPSRRLSKTVEESSTFPALVPTDVLSLVGNALPGQPVLTLSPAVAAPTVLQAPPMPGVASVTLNIPSLTNQQIQVTSTPRPPTAANLNDLLQLVQPPPPAPPLSVTPNSAAPPPYPGPSAGHQAEVTEGGPQREPREDGDGESLTSLLNEIVFLNQQTGATASPLPEKPSTEAGGRDDSPRLQLDANSDDTVTTETAESGPQPEHANVKGGVLAPPPLLQMKVGGAKVADPARGDGAAAVGGGGGGGGGGGERGQAGVAWRPMPRLVPLGLRGNPPC
ncbi:MAX dimerization protein MGA a [Pempheris klunzingeri]|uniref:MAX dimerization protein MGA a n=1 Tax=Pempheris klunzingeri TaxID=3127111 RepID=UPI00397EB892